MSLSSEYKRQFGWRDWPTVFRALPPVDGQTILDVGCGVGDLAAEFVARGARVIGVDSNEDLLRDADSRGLADAEFRKADLRSLAKVICCIATKKREPPHGRRASPHNEHTGAGPRSDRVSMRSMSSRALAVFAGCLICASSGGARVLYRSGAVVAGPSRPRTSFDLSMSQLVLLLGR